jgi:hypothetical protein
MNTLCSNINETFLAGNDMNDQKNQISEICQLVDFTVPFNVWAIGFKKEVKFRPWNETVPELDYSFIFKDRVGHDDAICKVENCVRRDIRMISDKHACDMAYPTALESSWDPPYCMPFNWSDEVGKSTCVIFSFTRDSSVTISNDDIIKHRKSHYACLRECCDYIQDIEYYKNIKMVSGRFFHKMGHSDETLLHSIASAGEDMFPFQLLLATLDDLPEITERIILAIRHALSLGCSGYHLRLYLQSIKNKNLTIFQKIDIFVTGHIFKKSKLLAEPFLISAEDLLFYLERYPISLTDSEDYIFSPVNNFFRSMFKELKTKLNQPGIGRSRTDVEICPIKRVETNMDQFNDTAQQICDTGKIDTKLFTRKQDTYIINWIMSEKEKNNSGARLKWKILVDKIKKDQSQPMSPIKYNSDILRHRIVSIQETVQKILQKKIPIMELTISHLNSYYDYKSSNVSPAFGDGSNHLKRKKNPSPCADDLTLPGGGSSDDDFEIPDSGKRQKALGGGRGSGDDGGRARAVPTTTSGGVRSSAPPTPARGRGRGGGSGGRGGSRGRGRGDDDGGRGGSRGGGGGGSGGGRGGSRGRGGGGSGRGGGGSGRGGGRDGDDDGGRGSGGRGGGSDISGRNE